METHITIKVPEEIGRQAEARARREGTTVSEVLRRRLEEFANEFDEAATTTADSTQGAQVLKISEFDPNRRLTSEELEKSLAILEKIDDLAEKIGQRWPAGLSAVDAIKEDRREL